MAILIIKCSCGRKLSELKVSDQPGGIKVEDNSCEICKVKNSKIKGRSFLYGRNSQNTLRERNRRILGWKNGLDS